MLNLILIARMRELFINKNKVTKAIKFECILCCIFIALNI
jgi:hypothetical protein